MASPSLDAIAPVPPPGAHWPHPGAIRSPQGREICLWLVNLAQSPPAEAQARALLSEDEREQADRFVFARDRRRYTIGRATLRVLLGEATGGPPQLLQFTYGPQKKPSLSTGSAWFNLSNSGDLALIGVTQLGELGVDLEVPRSLLDGPGLARSMFSLAEQAALASFPSEHWTTAFFRCWTRKEAYVKAIGDGLSAPLERFTVSLGPIAQLERLDGSQAAAARWTLIDERPASGVVAAAIAIEATDVVVHRYTCPPSVRNSGHTDCAQESPV
ncbi:MAG: 4'-phosphopantetheinyl transferase [Myxococcota bacterium]|jgi:4'-phosphopantetheinyl transferase